MGDRANIFLVDTEPKEAEEVHGIYLYSHWGGSGLPEDLRNALIFAHERWDDPSYLARIIADQVFAQERDQLTGAGISTMLTDNEYDIIVVDLVKQQVSFSHVGQERSPESWWGTKSFADYVAQEGAGWPPSEMAPDVG